MPAAVPKNLDIASLGSASVYRLVTFELTVFCTTKRDFGHFGAACRASMTSSRGESAAADEPSGSRSHVRWALSSRFVQLASEEQNSQFPKGNGACEKKRHVDFARQRS